MKWTSGAALVGLTAGLGFVASAAVPAGAATTTIRPYVFNQILVGQTDPGIWDNEACLISDAGTGDHGKINGSGSGTTLDINQVSVATGNPVSTCSPVNINVTGTVAGTLGTKPGGTLAVTTSSDVQGGISASSVVTIDVTYVAGQTVKLPSGAVLVSGSLTNPSGDTARLALKATAVKTKAVLTASCVDKVEVVDTNVLAGSKGDTPTATEWDGTSALTSGQYMATIRQCAEDPTNIAGKPVTTKIAIAGHGTSSASFIKANTVNPATWDTTLGTSCGAVKTIATGPHFGTTVVQTSRVIQCKGDYGNSVNFALDVRNWTTNGGEDPNGLNHPGPATNLGSFTF